MAAGQSGAAPRRDDSLFMRNARRRGVGAAAGATMTAVARARTTSHKRHYRFSSLRRRLEYYTLQPTAFSTIQQHSTLDSHRRYRIETQ